MYRAESPVPFNDLTSVGFSQRKKFYNLFKRLLPSALADGIKISRIKIWTLVQK